MFVLFYVQNAAKPPSGESEAASPNTRVTAQPLRRDLHVDTDARAWARAFGPTRWAMQKRIHRVWRLILWRLPCPFVSWRSTSFDTPVTTRAVSTSAFEAHGARCARG